MQQFTRSWGHRWGNRPASLWIVGEWVLRFGLMVETRFAFAAASGIRRRSATWTILLD
jgi:hypothetical protein